MDPIFEGFKKAYEEGNGYDLSMTLSPVDPDDEPDRLYNFFRSTNFSQVKNIFSIGFYMTVLRHSSCRLRKAMAGLRFTWLTGRLLAIF